MFEINKHGDYFTLLCLTDTQLNNWNFGDKSKYTVTEYTVKNLCERVKPDLIAILGDLSHAGHDMAYERTGDFFDSLGIPWTFCFGNHDMQKGKEPALEVAESYKKHKNLLFEVGDTKLGVGDFSVGIKVSGKPAEALVFMDTHHLEKYKNPNGSERDVHARLTKEQIEWYKTESEKLRAEGYSESTLMIHIPITAFRDAALAAFKEGVDRKSVTLEQSYSGECWSEGYKDSFGVQHEGLGIHPDTDGVFEVLKEVGMTKNVIAGHDHVNCTSILYDGIRLTYCLKTGPGYSWERELNGGTVLKINENGIYDLHHEFVVVSHLLDGVDF